MLARLRYEAQLLKVRFRLFWYGPVMLRNIHSWSQEIGESAEYFNDISSERRDSISNSELVADISELSGKVSSLAGWGTNYPITEIAGTEWKPGRP